MSDFNMVTLIGNAGGVAEVHQFQGGQVAKLSVATSRNYKDKSGEWQSATTWHTVVSFNEFVIEKMITVEKGDRVAVFGEVNTRSYEKDGQKRWVTEVNAQKIDVSKRAPRDSDAGPRSTAASAGTTEFEDDIPF